MRTIDREQWLNFGEFLPIQAAGAGWMVQLIGAPSSARESNESERRAAAAAAATVQRLTDALSPTASHPNAIHARSNERLRKLTLLIY